LWKIKYLSIYLIVLFLLALGAHREDLCFARVLSFLRLFTIQYNEYF